MSKAVPPAGVKRLCTSCGAKFYDLDKRPVVCPKCKVEQVDPKAIIS
jgi:uncharacterized protein (TIGR02300 family)